MANDRFAAELHENADRVLVAVKFKPITKPKADRVLVAVKFKPITKPKVTLYCVSISHDQ